MNSGSCSQTSSSWKLPIGKNYWYFVDIFNKIIISLAPVGYEMAIYHLISNAKISNTHPWNNFFKSPAIADQIWKNFAILN